MGDAPSSGSADRTARRLWTAHWVLWVLVVALVAAGVAGWRVMPPRPVPGWALRQVVIYRVEFAGVLVVLGYVVLVALRLAWHNQTFSRISVAGAAAEAPAERAAADELTQLKADIEVLSGQTTAALTELQRRLEALERAGGGTGPGVS